MTDGEVEKIIRSNMNLQMNLAGIRADFEEKLQRTWVGLTEEDLKLLSAEWRIVYGAWMDDFARDIEAKLKEKNT